MQNPEVLALGISLLKKKPFHSELIATVPAIGGSVLLFTFAYPVGAFTSYMSIVTVTDPDQQVWFFWCFLFPSLPACLSSFTDWCLVHRQQSREQKSH